MRDAILSAAGSLVARHGGHPVLDEVAAATGISTRELQHYFTSGTAIEYALVDHLAHTTDPWRPVGSVETVGDLGTDRPDRGAVMNRRVS